MTVDVIVIFSFETIELVRACLESVIRETNHPFGMTIINNGCRADVTKFLCEFAVRNSSIINRVLRNKEACGYPPAANQGLRASLSDYCLLLNGDTVVTRGWLGKMIECADSHPRVGIVGPLSNAASWQSVPERSLPTGEWSTNPLPENCTPNDVGELVTEVSQREFPWIPLINGFCILIKRTVINAIGYFDDVTFAEGYGEEDDYCLRAAGSGFVMAVADHAYVYHAKTKAYGSERRLRLCREAKAKLIAKYGSQRISENVIRIQASRGLERCRQEVVRAFPDLKRSCERKGRG